MVGIGSELPPTVACQHAIDRRKRHGFSHLLLNQRLELRYHDDAALLCVGQYFVENAGLSFQISQCMVAQCGLRKYPKAVAKLEKDRTELLAFYDYPAEHWRHIRTTNAIESTFATVRHRTSRTKNCVSRNSFIGLGFKMLQQAGCA